MKIEDIPIYYIEGRDRMDGLYKHLQMVADHVRQAYLIRYVDIFMHQHEVALHSESNVARLAIDVHTCAKAKYRGEVRIFNPKTKTHQTVVRINDRPNDRRRSMNVP